MRRDVFQAIADPTRREIIFLIAQRPLPLNSIAENFQVSRPAISKHIKILTECGIVTIHNRGRERYCEARLQTLSEVSKWVEHVRVFWNQKLDALGAFLEKETPPAARAAAKAPPATRTPPAAKASAAGKAPTSKTSPSRAAAPTPKTPRKKN